MNQYSILLAHRHEPKNDDALLVAINSMLNSADMNFTLLIDTETPADPYQAWNKLARQAVTEWIIFTNSDVFFAPHFDSDFLRGVAPDTIATGVLVEAGAIGVSPANVHQDFGMRPDTYDRLAFHNWASLHREDTFPGDGWYMPCMMHRDTFVRSGGFATSDGAFPQPLDIWFWERWRGMGNKVKRVNSFAYHLQNWSNPLEQGKAVRFG